MKKKILYAVLIVLCFFSFNNIYSQAQYLSAGEKTGVVIDSLLKVNPVDGVEIKHYFSNGTIIATELGEKSADFKISGQFIVLKGDRKVNLDKEIYYNLNKVISFTIIDRKLIIYLEV